MNIHNYRLILILLIFSLNYSCSRIIAPGKYRTNFATYGMFGQTLTINCDSTVILNFAGDLMNDNSYGKWTTFNDTLIITFDTINHPNCRFKNRIDLLIQGHRLYNIPFTRKQYNDLIEKIKKSGNDTIKIPSYRKFNRQLDKNMTDSKGTMKRQYFKIVDKFDCKE